MFNYVLHQNMHALDSEEDLLIIKVIVNEKYYLFHIKLLLLLVYFI